MKSRPLTFALLLLATAAHDVTVTGGSPAGPGAGQVTPARDRVGSIRRVRPAIGSARISGIVVGLSSRQPIDGATVSLYGPGFPDGVMRTTADGDGRFVFSGLMAGRYTVGASKTGS